MLPEEKQKRIEQIKEVLQAIHIVPLATVNPDATPHNTPVFMAFDTRCNAVWASHPDTQHSQNISRNGHVYAVVFDSRARLGGGLYIEAEAIELEPGQPDFRTALATYARAKQNVGAPAPQAEDYSQQNGQRLYLAVPKHLWINFSTKDKNGVIRRDQRFRITPAALADDDL